MIHADVYNIFESDSIQSHSFVILEEELSTVPSFYLLKEETFVTILYICPEYSFWE